MGNSVQHTISPFCHSSFRYSTWPGDLSILVDSVGTSSLPASAAAEEEAWAAAVALPRAAAVAEAAALKSAFSPEARDRRRLSSRRQADRRRLCSFAP
jgi:hypothetical protein